MSHVNEKMMLYIIDDDDSVRKSMSRLMRSAGIESRAYGCAEQAFSEICNQKPACIILDITMPRLNGLELCAQLRDKGVALPVIAVSARDDDETRQLARDMGVIFFLRKPVDDQALLDAISWVTPSGI